METFALGGAALLLFGLTHIASGYERAPNIVATRAAMIGRMMYGVAMPAFGVLHFVYIAYVAFVIPNVDSRARCLRLRHRCRARRLGARHPHRRARPPRRVLHGRDVRKLGAHSSTPRAWLAHYGEPSEWTSMLDRARHVRRRIAHRVGALQYSRSAGVPSPQRQHTRETSGHEPGRDLPRGLRRGDAAPPAPASRECRARAGSGVRIRNPSRGTSRAARVVDPRLGDEHRDRVEARSHDDAQLQLREDRYAPRGFSTKTCARRLRRCAS